MFIATLQELQGVSEAYGAAADFAIIYVEEAHPTGTWNFKHQINVADHANLEDRLEAARLIQEMNINLPIFVDTMDNKVSRAFGAWPERLYILLDDVVVYQGGPGPFEYSMNDLRENLRRILKEISL